jgi:ATP-binding cassette subfamily B protein
MLPLLLSSKPRFFGSLAAAFAALVAAVLIPRVTMNAIDDALIDQTSSLAPYIWALLGLAVFRSILTFGYRSSLYGLAYRLEYDLRVIVFEHLTRLSFSFYDRVQSGQLISRANSDIRSVQMFLTFAPLVSLSLASFVIALVFMFTIHIGLTAVALSTIPFVYIAGVKLRNQTFPLSWIVQSRMADVATIVDENVNGVRVVKSFAAEQSQVDELAGAAERLKWASVRTALTRARYAPLMENLPRLGLAAVLLYGGWLAIEGEITVGAIVAFNTYVIMLQAPFRLLGMITMLGQRAAASAARIYEILDEPPEIVDRPGAFDLETPRGEIEFDDVTFAYRRPGADQAEPVLDRFSLRVAPGETVAIVGRTGSGKSTIARLLPRFYDVDAGSVRVDGHDVRDLTLGSLRANLAVVLDEPFLFSTTIRENIAYSRPDTTSEEVEAAARAAHADEFIDHLPMGYDTIIGERGYDLSGGQRQRIAIARTLLANPPMLVLDDATSAVDVQVEERIHGALRNLLEGRTTLVIAHRLSTINLADRVVLVEGGRVVADGTHAHLMATEPRYVEVLARAEHGLDGRDLDASEMGELAAAGSD